MPSELPTNPSRGRFLTRAQRCLTIPPSARFYKTDMRVMTLLFWPPISHFTSNKASNAMTPFGAIAVKWQRTAHGIEVTVITPKNVGGTLSLPGETDRKLLPGKTTEVEFSNK